MSASSFEQDPNLRSKTPERPLEQSPSSESIEYRKRLSQKFKQYANLIPEHISYEEWTEYLTECGLTENEPLTALAIRGKASADDWHTFAQYADNTDDPIHVARRQFADALFSSREEEFYEKRALKPTAKQEIKQLNPTEIVLAVERASKNLPSVVKHAILTGLALGLDALNTSKSVHHKPIRINAELLYRNLSPALEILAKQKTERQQPLFEAVRDEVIRDLHELFPSIDPARIQSRAKTLKFALQTAVKPYSHWDGSYGSYSPHDHEVHVPLAQEFRTSTYRHEILHGLSRSENTATRIQDPELSEDARRRLTESIVEEITQMMDPDTREEKDSYYMERGILLHNAQMRGAGARFEIPLAVFAEALFSEDKSLRSALQRHGISDEQIQDILERIEENARDLQ